ncbi:MAG: hypothetical protein QOI10_2568 [Solirubrobacterales bacterium]|jgi:hypothetical protein|nr:hypothetical protein [Solirubrobacterales bacterium]
MSPRGATALIALLVAAAALLAAGPGAAPANAAADGCYFPSTFFCQSLATDAAIDPDSATFVSEVRNMAYGVDPHTHFDCRHAVMTDNTAQWTGDEQRYCQKLTYRAGINYDAYAPMLYTVGADQGRVPVILDAGDPSLRAAFLAGVPIPPDAQSASGTDGQLIIYQPSSDTMWEFWRARKDIAGAWRAAYGGVIRDASKNPGHYEDSLVPFQSHTWGGPSSSIPNLPGLLTIDELRSGVIGHALVFATWANSVGQWVYPAQRTDGRCQGAAGQYCADVPQGARFRLDPNFDVSTIDNPITRMIAKAVQDYGMVLNNTTGAGLTFYAEGWRGHPGATDPYYGPGGLFKSDPQQTAPTQFLREFPWEHLQMLQRGPACSNAVLQCEQPAGWPFAGSGTSTVPAPSPARVRLRLARPKIRGRKLIVSGRVRPPIAGTVAVTCRCAGLTRDRKVKQADVRDGLFRAAFRLAGDKREGRYAVVARYGGDASYSRARARRAFRIR